MGRTTTPRATWLAPLPATFTWAQARSLGLSNHALYELRNEHLIEQLGRGLYGRADRPLSDPDLLAPALRAPRATLCLRSALARQRCIVDAFRLRRLEGPELGNEALKRWLSGRGAQPSALLQMASQFPRAAAPLRRSLEVLL